MTRFATNLKFNMMKKHYIFPQPGSFQESFMRLEKIVSKLLMIYMS